MINETLKTAFGNYRLSRLPVQKNQPLRAWDAADEYILNYLHEKSLPSTNSKVLIINDAFGALSLSLRQNHPQNWSDSFLSQQACLHNFQNNGLKITVDLVRSTEAPSGNFDLVLIKIPKTLALLEDQLIRLKAHIHPKTQIVAAAMVKYLPKSTLNLFEKVLGKTTTSLAKKKARLVFCQYENTGEPLQSPYPKCKREETTQLDLCNHANVFSKDKLDIGTRFMLEQFNQLPQKQHIVDLGCGNGILGIVAQQQQREGKLHFLDESYMAVASAENNYQKAFPNMSASFTPSDCLTGLTDNVDLILCNPPFHQQHSIGDFIAWKMFSQSQQRLNDKGELWVVGNRHLNYHGKLKKLFGNCDLIGSNRKFVVLRATKR